MPGKRQPVGLHLHVHSRGPYMYCTCRYELGIKLIKQLLDLHKSDDCSILWKDCVRFQPHLGLQVESIVYKNKKMVHV